MISRDRVKIALNHKEPDKIPIDLGSMVSTFTADSQAKLRAFLGLDGSENIYSRVEQTVIPDERILKRLHVDVRYLYLNSPKNWKDIELGNNTYKDEFGIIRKKASFYYDIIHHPLGDAKYPEQIEKYPWPDPRDPSRFEGLEKEAKRLYENTEFALATANAEVGSIFENCWYMVGFNKFLEDLLVNPDFATELLKRWCNYWIAVNDELLDRVGDYIEYVTVGDDLTFQIGLMMSMDVYRKMIKPWQKKLYSFIKSKTNAKIYYHICGTVKDILNDLIDVGIDILQPVQKEAAGNNLSELKKNYGLQITFCGGISQQKTMPFGTVEAVREEVKETIKILAPGGGYMFVTGHNIQPDVPPENILAAYDIANEFGCYPLNK